MELARCLADDYNLILNEEQATPVNDLDTSYLCLAPPGSGKTSTMIAMLGVMVIYKGINPKSIMNLTFSKAAANEMKDRFEKLFGDDIGKMMNFSTIHSFSFQVVRTHFSKSNSQLPVLIEEVPQQGNDKSKNKSFVIEGSGENGDQAKKTITKAQLLKNLYLKHNGEFMNDEEYESLANWIGKIKNMMLDVEDIDARTINIKNFKSIYYAYESEKEKNNWIDFDDMLVKAYGILRTNADLLQFYRSRYKYINVDEAQDTSRIQHAIIRLIAGHGCRVFFIADVDQTIYGFRGAYPEALMNFTNLYPNSKVHYLVKNYRSTKNIVNAASHFIKYNTKRFENQMSTDNEAGEMIKHTCFNDINEQYEYIADALIKTHNFFSEYAVLYRTNLSAIPIADILERNNIPFYMREHKTHFFKNRITQDIMAFFNLARNEADLSSFELIYYKMNGFFTKLMIEFLKERMGGSPEDSGQGRGAGRGVFDMLQDYPTLRPTQAGTILRIKSSFNRILAFSPKDAIEYIEEALGYGDYLRKKNKGVSSEIEGSFQVLNCLKAIASFSYNADEFIKRLAKLEEVIKASKKNKGEDAVTLTPIHSSKGLEFDRIFIVDLLEGLFPSMQSIEDYKSGNVDLMEEEARVFYVGVTRARKELELLSAVSVNGNFACSSRFIHRLLSVSKT